jgi:DHA1 family multidrug resistance protein-like MFS transporter
VFHLDGFSVPFILAALLGFVVLLIIIKWLKNTEIKKRIVSEAVKFSFSLSNYFIILLLLSFAIQFVVTLFETVFSIYGKDELAFTTNQVGIGFMLCGSVMAVLQPVFATYGEKMLTSKQQITLGLLISGVSLIVFPFVSGELYIYGTIIIFAAGGAMVTPNLLSAISLISRDNTGRNISIQSSTNSIGQILGPVLGTWLIAGGFYYPFIIAGATIFGAMGLVYFLKRPNKGIDGPLSIKNFRDGS